MVIKGEKRNMKGLEKYMFMKSGTWIGFSKEKLEKEMGYDVTKELNELMKTRRVEEFEVDGDIFYKLAPEKVIRRAVVEIDEQLMNDGILKAEKIKEIET